MLPLGIAIMVASVAVGVIALTLVAVMSPAARSAGRRTRIAMALSDEEDAPAANRTRETAAPHRTTEADAPRWVIVSVIMSGVGLLIGLLMVMIASIP